MCLNDSKLSWSHVATREELVKGSSRNLQKGTVQSVLKQECPETLVEARCSLFSNNSVETVNGTAVLGDDCRHG